MRDPGTLKSQCASITSRPLFIIVAESTEILRPIAQFGCLQASSGVTRLSVDGSRVRNGPPDARRMDLPARAAASVGARPAAPTIAATTVSQLAFDAASTSACGP